MSDTSSVRLEQGTALSLLWDAADDLRLTAAELQTAAEAHAMTTFQFLRDLADGDAPDPSALLRSRGQVEALLGQLNQRADLEGAHLDELSVTLAAPDLSDPLEVRALATFQDRHRRRTEPLPEDPRPVEQEG